MRSTGTTHRQLEFWEEEVVEDLFIEGKSLQDRSMESNENDRVPGKVIKYWHHPQTAVVWGGVVGGGHVHIWEELDEKHWREVGEEF